MCHLKKKFYILFKWPLKLINLYDKKLYFSVEKYEYLSILLRFKTSLFEMKKKNWHAKKTTVIALAGTFKGFSGKEL